MFENSGKTLVWAHRGASGYAPENTMEAFRLAAEQGADGIELDVQMTKDGELVVIHDEAIDRTSTGSGYVREYTLAQLRQFDFNQTHPEYAHAQIPLLAEVLDLIAETGMQLNIELKNGIFEYEGMEEKVIRLVHEKKVQNQIIYSSFNHYSIARVGTLDSNAKRGILYSDRWINVPEYASELSVDAIHPAFYHLTDASLVQKCHARGMHVHVWTVNEEAYMKECLRQGVDAIITNYPNLCRQVVDGWKQ